MVWLLPALAAGLRRFVVDPRRLKALYPS